MSLDNFTTDDTTVKGGGKGSGSTSYSDEELLDALVEFKEEHGEFTTKDYQKLASKPSYSTIQRRFGTFNEARIKAGIGVNKSGGKRTTIEDTMKKPSSEKAFVVGCLLTDGWIHRSDSGAHVGFQVKDKDLAQEFALALSDWANLDWYGWNADKTEMEARGPIDVEGTNNDNWRVKKGSKEIAKHLSSYEDMTADGLINHFSDYTVTLLTAIWDCEGSVSGNQIRFANSDSELCKLYMKLLDTHTELDYTSDWEWASSCEKFRKYGDFTVSSKISDTEVRNITLPVSFNSDFNELVNSNLRRKREKLKGAVN